MATEDIDVTDSSPELDALKIEAAALRRSLDGANARALRAERSLTDFKEAVVNEAVQYVANSGPCSTVTEILDNLGLELPSRTVSFEVVVRTTVTVTFPANNTEDPENDDVLRDLIDLDNDGTVNIRGDVENVSVSSAELESIENIDLEEG